MPTLVVLGVVGLLVGLHGPAAAARGDERTQMQDRALAASCAACHGSDGRSLPASPVPALAGFDAVRFRAAMDGYRRGSREGTVMPQIAKGYTDDQIDRLAVFFASLPASTK